MFTVIVVIQRTTLQTGLYGEITNLLSQARDIEMFMACKNAFPEVPSIENVT